LNPGHRPFPVVERFRSSRRLSITADPRDKIRSMRQLKRNNVVARGS
jgi:hypothetical protein